MCSFSSVNYAHTELVNLREAWEGQPRMPTYKESSQKSIPVEGYGMGSLMTCLSLMLPCREPQPSSLRKQLVLLASTAVSLLLCSWTLENTENQLEFLSPRSGCTCYHLQ